ncbi:MAG TPA: hypothetical protein VFF73_08440 [Planctomycetota bacterium]|nr:hypothetical protein [Planctomycetota bacterium]
MDLPSAIEKRNMLYAPDPRRPFDAVAIGDAFSEKGRHPEALDFYERVQDPKTREERIGRIKTNARMTGNAFLLGRIASKGFLPVSKDDWRECANAAKQAGLLRHALRSAIQAGEEALMAEMRAALGDAVPAALAAQAESPEQAKAGATTPGHKVEAVAATGAAHSHQPGATEAPPAATDGDGAKPSA